MRHRDRFLVARHYRRVMRVRWSEIAVAVACVAPCVAVGCGAVPSDPCAEPSAGEAPLRRLTRSQYRNVVFDVLGALDAGAGLPGDERIGPFTSNLAAPVGDLLVEQYMLAAEDVAGRIDVAALASCTSGEPAICTRAFLDRTAARLYRRPPEEAEIDALAELAGSAASYEDGVRLAVEAMLQSPSFLYHLELDRTGVDGSDLIALDDFEVAARLAFLLWDSAPDAALLEAAAAGHLGDGDGVRAQAQRMLDDPRADRGVARFFLEWLGVDELERLEKSDAFPEMDDAMRLAMRIDTERFGIDAMRSGADLAALLGSEQAFPSGSLFELYGVPAPADADPPRPVDLPHGERSGILTLASVMAVHANADQSSPIRRGLWVRRNLLCEDLPPPPADLPLLPPAPDPDATTRERFQLHTSDPACSGCHSKMDPIGFAFEHYDAIGRYREAENGAAIDADGELTGTDVDGEFEGAIELGELLAKSEQVRDCVTTQWMRFALGRFTTEDDVCSVDGARGEFEDADLELRALVLALVSSDSFRYRRRQAEP